MARHTGRNWALLGGNAFPLTPGLIYGLTPYRWHTLYLITDSPAAETGIETLRTSILRTYGFLCRIRRIE